MKPILFYDIESCAAIRTLHMAYEKQVELPALKLMTGQAERCYVEIL